MDNKRNSLTVAIILTACLLSGIKIYMEQGKAWVPAVLLAAGFAVSFGAVALLGRWDAYRSIKKRTGKEDPDDKNRSHRI